MTENGSVRSYSGRQSNGIEYQIDLDNLEEDYENGDSRFIAIEEPDSPPPVPPRTSSTTGFLKRIDFVLVYRTTRSNPSNLEAPQQNFESIRAVYEGELEKEGLVLQQVESTVGNEYNYVHIYAPWDTLARYAEVMALRMPMCTVVSKMNSLFEDSEQETSDEKSDFMGPNSRNVFTTIFSRDKEYLFAIPPDREEFFTPSQRSEIIEFILRRTRSQTEYIDVFSIGINKLISDAVYVAAYPLHDESAECDQQNCPTKRCQLKSTWASLTCILKKQPFDEMVAYFGVKISMYYAWIGFYTFMLIPAALFGLITVLYGYFTMLSSEPVKDVCTHGDNLLMCPTCVINCNYTRVAESCFEAKTTHIFGNWLTIGFAILISIWATFYLEFWKRYSARIGHSWDLSEFSIIDEYPRPEFLNTARIKKRHVNPVTGLEEPYVPFFVGRLPYFIISSSFVLLCIVMALLIMVSIIVYRVSVQIALYTIADPSHFLNKYADNIVTITAAIINLFLILLLSWVYKKLAFFLTELEVPRTQAEFDNSLTLKMFLFEFVNYYSSFFYIAFIKGRFRLQPPEGGLQRSNVAAGNFLQESCPLGGCYHDLAVQMVIIFVGKAMLNACFEYLGPYINSLYNRHKYFSRTMQSAEKPKKLQQWEEDFILESWDQSLSLFYEYLELVIQYGFVTLFVAAFPLAPLLALLNNIFEIRLDARKMLLSYKRPVAQRVKDIGIWYAIMDAIGKLSVFTNSMIIAFTTDIIPQVVYYFEKGSLVNYFDSTLSYYEITKLDPKLNASYCLYNAYRHPPWVFGLKYEYTEQHWTMFIWRIIFVVVFQNLVAAINSLLKMLIPDVPRSILMSKRRHMYLTNELIIRHELVKKSKSCRSGERSKADRTTRRRAP